MSKKGYRSYRDALTGGRNEFIGTPVTSSGLVGASGASADRDENHEPSGNSSNTKSQRSSGRKVVGDGSPGSASKVDRSRRSSERVDHVTPPPMSAEAGTTSGEDSSGTLQEFDQLDLGRERKDAEDDVGSEHNSASGSTSSK